MRPKAEWAVDSEAMKARGIIVLANRASDISYGCGAAKFR